MHDIQDGARYRQLMLSVRADPKRKNHHIFTMNWNADGVKLVKSSKTSIWLLLMTINEIPAHARFMFKNVVVAGVAVGTTKVKFKLNLD